jgi:hypothetical protein
MNTSIFTYRHTYLDTDIHAYAHLDTNKQQFFETNLHAHAHKHAHEHAHAHADAHAETYKLTYTET